MAGTGRWLLWGSYCALWTTLLLLPAGAIDSFPGQEIIAGIRFLVAKTLHIVGYTLMTILSGWLHVPGRFRWLLVFFLMGHATATEIIQQFVKGRSGELRDVALDHLGVVIGLVLTWKWWVKRDEPLADG